MAKVLRESPFDGVPEHAKYPWDKWFDGQAWELVRGEDFRTDAFRFRMTVQSAASRRGLHLRSRVEGDRLVIQAFPAGAKP